MAVVPISLKQRLEEVAKKQNAVAFGVARVEDADAMEPIKIGWIINRWTKPLRDTLPDARSVIVFGIPSEDDADELEIHRLNGSWEYPGYVPLRIVMRDLIRVLREAGFNAVVPSVYSSHKRIAQLAGIGRYGKSSLIITPKHGPWLRFGMVVTNAPLAPDRAFEKDLCGKCTRCINACPAKALTPYVVDPAKCLVGMTQHSRIPEGARAKVNRYEPLFSPRTRVMCTECQLACRYTPPERRQNVAISRSRRRGKRS